MLKEGLTDNLIHGTICLGKDVVDGLAESLKILEQSTKKTVVETVEYKYGNEAG